MPKIEIFETAGYCTANSVVVSDEAIEQSVSVEQAKEDGVDIQRYSPAKNLQQFLNTLVIRKFLNIPGMGSLPITLPDGKLVITGKLPTREDIARWASIPLIQGRNEDGTQLRCYSIPHMP